MVRYTVLFFLAFVKMDGVIGHGRLMDPPARNAMWRLGFPNPVNFDDNGLFCGGYATQWSNDVAGKCGPCGDSWTNRAPRQHESGGAYANGLIGRTYAVGQVIDVEIELTANHQGFFELHLCPRDDLKKTEGQECFDRFPLNVEGQSTHRYAVLKKGFRSRKIAGGHEVFKYRVKLPDGVTCNHCVIQWTYRAGNSWGPCGNGTGALGCGPQETFRNCADVTITKSGPIGSDQNPNLIKVWTRNTVTQEESYEPLIVRSQVCFARNSKFRSDDWCMQNCLKYPPNCPELECFCPTSCSSDGTQPESSEDSDLVCQKTCLSYSQRGKCPRWCSCT